MSNSVVTIHDKLVSRTEVSHQKSANANNMNSMRWTCTTIIGLVFLLHLVNCQGDFDEFDINADLRIDAPPVTPMSTGLEDMLHLGINGPKSSLPIGGGATPSHIHGAPPPQPNYPVNTDLSGWGPIGKMHPNLIVKDRIVSAYHNRHLDPRYTHLKGYGHQALAGPTGLPPVKPGIGDKIATFF